MLSSTLLGTPNGLRDGKVDSALQLRQNCAAANASGNALGAVGDGRKSPTRVLQLILNVTVHCIRCIMLSNDGNSDVI